MQRGERGREFFERIFLKENKGLSDVIVMLIMIVLVLVAVGILWVAVRGTIDTGAEQVELGSKCLNVELKISKLECGGVNNDVCNVTVSRSAGGDEIAGMKLVFTNEDEEANAVIDVLGDISPLDLKTESDINTGIANTSVVQVVPYFTDSSGNEQLCSATDTFSA